MSKAGFRNSVVVRFAFCDHTRIFEYPYPKPGDELYCPDCHTARIVAELPEQYGAICKKKACVFARRSRPDLESAIKTSRSHMKSRPSHEVWVYKGDTPVYYVMKDDEGEIFQGQQHRDVAKDTQTILRDFLDKAASGADNLTHDEPC